MKTLEVTSLSSKGQIVIPKNIREELGIKEGTKFIVLTNSGNLLLKKVEEPNLSEFESLLNESRQIGRRKMQLKNKVEKIIADIRN